MRPPGFSPAGFLLPEVAMPRGRPVAQAKRETFLEHLRNCGCVLEAHRLAGLRSSTVYRLRKREPDFARA